MGGMLYSAEQHGVSTEKFEAVKETALSLVGLAGVRFADNDYDVDFTLYRLVPQDFGRFLDVASRTRVTSWQKPELGSESLQIELSHYGVDQNGEHHLFSTKTNFTFVSSILKYASQSMYFPLAKQKVPEAPSVFADDPHRTDFADWAYELRGEYGIGDESCDLLIADLEQVAASD